MLNGYFGGLLCNQLLQGHDTPPNKHGYAESHNR